MSVSQDVIAKVNNVDADYVKCENCCHNEGTIVGNVIYCSFWKNNGFSIGKNDYCLYWTDMREADNDKTN